MPETISRVSIPVSTVSFKSFLVLATFSAATMVETRISIFWKSSNEHSAFCGSASFASASFAALVACNLATCASTTLSSIFSNRSSALPITWPAGSTSASPRRSQSNFSMLSILIIFAAEKGINGSMAIDSSAVICNAMLRMVLTRSGSVFTTFHGSVSARYLLPKRARFIASFNASRKR